MREVTLTASDNIRIQLGISESELVAHYEIGGVIDRALHFFIALGTHRDIGAAVLPFAQGFEGSTVFLPFKCDLLLSAAISDGQLVCFARTWEHWKWSERQLTRELEVTQLEGTITFRIPRAILGPATELDFAMYAKDPMANDGWGWFFGCSDRSVAAGIGDKYIPHYHKLSLGEAQKPAVYHRRLASSQSKTCVYQLFVRLFSNTNEQRKCNGTFLENGVGKFDDITDKALVSLSRMGFTHLWLTGVLRHATGTDYSSIGLPADDADLLKGIAGSPYAIKDYFDVCPDYAMEPAHRLTEFKALIDRIHAQGLKVLIDFIPNHVARCYQSSMRPDLSFGMEDDRSQFFHPNNNFFYLQLGSPPLQLPTWKNGVALSPTCGIEGRSCDGLYEGELNHGKATGNNAATWTPGLNDWYETVKLNYGFDFTDSLKLTREYPNAITPGKAIPDTWQKMDQVIAYWQSMRIDGFRCDMAHMVPPEFWHWLIDGARQRSPDTIFIGEAYDRDPAKVPGSDPFTSQLNDGQGNVLFDLLNAGFNAVYDDPTYKTLKNLYDGSGWANDLDYSLGHSYIFNNSLRYAENHDEVRLAAAGQWGGIGMMVGLPVAAILYGLSSGAVLLYNGQEVGEPGAGAEGFGGDDARTSIFDYWSMPELARWVNQHHYDGGRLSPEQRRLRSAYKRLVKLLREPAFRDGEFLPLNPINRDNPSYGRLPNEQASGHWLYSFLRYHALSGQRFLILVNLHPSIDFHDVRVCLSGDALRALGLETTERERKLILRDRLTDESDRVHSSMEETIGPGIPFPRVKALTAFYFEIVIS